MGVLTRAGSFAKTSGTGSQTITGVGFTPTAVIFWTAGKCENIGNLGVNITAVSASILVTGNAGWPTGGFVIQIDSEQILVNTFNGTNTFSSITRAYNGTTAASHTAGTGNIHQLSTSNADGVQDGAFFSFGFDDGTRSNSWGMATRNGGASASVQAYTVGTSGGSLSYPNPYDNSTTPNLGVISSFNSDGFVYNATNSGSTDTGMIINYFAIGGCSAHVGIFTPTGSNGNASVTGVGFRPKVILTTWVVTASGGSFVFNNGGAGLQQVGNLGMATATHQGTISLGNVNASNPTNAGRYQRTNKFITRMNGNNHAGVAVESTVVSMDADGFTYNTTISSATGRFGYLALDCEADIGSFNQPVNIGSLSVGSLNLLPKGVMMMSTNHIASTAIEDDLAFTLGAFDGVNQVAAFAGQINGITAPTIGARGQWTDRCMSMVTPAGTLAASTTIDAVGQGASLDGYGFTTYWPTVDGTSRQVLYLVLGDVLPSPPPTPSDDPAVMDTPNFWAAIRTIDTRVTYLAGQRPLRDPGTYYGGPKEPRLLEAGPITRLASDYLSGSLPAQVGQIKMSDTDRKFRTLFASTRFSMVNCEMWIYLISEAKRLALQTPRLVFYGKIHHDTPSPNLTYDIEANDPISIGYSVLADEVNIPQRHILLSDFPGCPNESVDQGAPIIGGVIENGVDGALQLIDVGDFVCADSVTRRAVLVACHACFQQSALYQDVSAETALVGAVTDVGLAFQVQSVADFPSTTPFDITIDADLITITSVTTGPDTLHATTRGGTAAAHSDGAKVSCTTGVVEIPAGDFGVNAWMHGQTGWTDVSPSGASYIDINNHRYSLVFVSDIRRTNLIAGKNLYIDVQGLETVGDGTGTLITNLLSQYLHLMQNFILGDYQVGGWLASPVFDFFPGGTSQSILDEASWATASTVASGYLGGGFVGAFVIGAQGKFSPLRQVIADLNVSSNVMLGMHNDNQLFVVMLDRNRSSFLNGAAIITDRHNVLVDPDIPYELKHDWWCTDLGFQYAANYRNDGRGDWNGSNSTGRAASRVAYGGVKTFRDRYPFVQDAPTAEAVAGQRMDFMADIPRAITWSESLAGLRHDVLSGVPISHYGVIGLTNIAFWVIQQVVDQKTNTVTLTAIDVQHLVS